MERHAGDACAAVRRACIVAAMDSAELDKRHVWHPFTQMREWSAGEPLVIVEGFFDCIKLWQLGLRRVVALMGSSLSPAQEELIGKHTNSRSRVLVMLDEDDAGRAGRDEIARRLARFVFVKTHVFDAEGRQPENLTAEEVAGLYGGVE